MQNLKLTIEYDGTNFNGWQIQANSQRTVQGEIEKALNKILKQKVKLIGSGRTDSGVHAIGQVANTKINTKLSPVQFKNALNANLPSDISILDVQKANKNFHAQYSVKSKTYRYTILNRDTRSAQNQNYSLFYPHRLNVRLMREEAKELIGRKDFKSFEAADAARKERNTVRNVKGIDIRKHEDYITIDIEANGFLYKMVRNIVGTLLKIGRGQMQKGSMKAILEKKDRSLAGATAKAQGLTLIKVTY